MWISKVIQSWRYALEGLKYTIVTQRNMRIHVIISLVVLLLGLYLPLTKLEVMILFMCIGLVLFAELINTVMETIVDLVTEDFHPLAKVAKDVAAGAVLLMVGLAVIVGISLFYPYLNQLFIGIMGEPNYAPSIGLALVITFDFFLTLLVKALFHRMKKEQWEPSMTTSIACCVAALIAIVIGKLMVALLVYLMAVMIVTSRYRMKPRWIPLGIGALIGTAVAILGLVLLGGW